MFKTALSSLKSAVVTAAKNTARAYSPSSILKEEGAFSRIAQQGIANLSFRSPILADIAQTMLQNVQLEAAKKQEIDKYVKSDSAGEFRGAVKEKMGKDTPDKKIDVEMSKILSEISKSIEKNGQEETKKSALFKEYESYFRTFKSSEEKSINKDVHATKTSSISETAASEPVNTSETAPTLNRIETNTKHTANTLEELVSRTTSNTATGNAGDKNSSSFIDPVTGMPSVRAAIGSIGGSFLSKVFDNDTLERFAKKAKDLFGIDNIKETSKSDNIKETSKSDNIKETSKSDNIKDIIKETSKSDNIKDIIKETSKSDNIKETSKSDNIKETSKSISRPTTTGIQKNTISEILDKINLDLTVGNTENTEKSTEPNNILSKVLGNINSDISTGNIENKKESNLEFKQSSEQLLDVNKDILAELKGIHTDISKSSGKEPVQSGDKKTNSITDIIRDKVVEKIQSKLPGAKDALGNAKDKVIQVSKKGIAKTINGAKNAARYIPGVSQTGSALGRVAITAGAEGVGAAGAAGTAGGVGVLGGLARGAATLGGAVLASPVALGGLAVAGGLAAGAAIDSGFGALGFGNKAIDEKQDDKNWNRASTWDKIKSAPARGLEKVSSAMFLGNLSNEAKSERIANETKYLDDKVQAASGKKIPEITPVLQNNAAVITSLTKDNEKATSDKAASQTNTIIQNLGSQSSAPAAPAAAPTVIVGTNVRNTESTFERVQMQDFWSRVA